MCELARGLGLERPLGEAPPPRARPAKAALLATRLVAAERRTIEALVQTHQAWVTGRSSRRVRIRLAGDMIEVTNTPDEHQRPLIEALVVRHASALP